MAEALTVTPGEGTQKLLERYLKYAESSIEKCKSLSHINGSQKLERKCHSELKYLKSLSKRRGGFDDSNVRSSNLGHYLGVLHAAENLTEVTHILQAFSCPGRSEPLHADVVAGRGRIWVKVIARKAQALHLVWAGKGQYGERDVLFQAEEYVTCSKEHPVNFVEPEVVFAFYNGVTEEMALATKQIGVFVLGNIVNVSSDVIDKLKHLDLSDSDSDMDSDDSNDTGQLVDESEMSLEKEVYAGITPNSDGHSYRQEQSNPPQNIEIQSSKYSASFITSISQNTDRSTSAGDLVMLPLIDFTQVNDLLSKSINNTVDSIRKVNLDVSSLITLVSAVTHGRCFYRFKEPVLSEQAMEERTHGSLPTLESFLEGKELYACEAAIQSFKSILDTLGGDAEVLRAECLLKQLTIVPDNPSFRTQTLPRTGKIKDRAKIIFGTGDSLKAVTVTANSAFVRAAIHQGCQYAAYIHPARALTEKKEGSAEFLGELKGDEYHTDCRLFKDVCADAKR